MKLIACEGICDAKFIKSIIDNFGFSALTVFDREYGIDKRGYKKLQKIFLYSPSHIFQSYNAVIYGDNGKRVFISKIIPHLVYDFIGKSDIDVLIVIDDDGISHGELLNSIKEKMDVSTLCEKLIYSIFKVYPLKWTCPRKSQKSLNLRELVLGCL
jgi:hypothetical protein